MDCFDLEMQAVTLVYIANCWNTICHTDSVLRFMCVCVCVCVCVDPGILLHSFVGQVQSGNVSVKIILIPRVTGK